MDATKLHSTVFNAASRAKETSFAPLERDGGAKRNPEELAEALKDFEALFVNPLLQVMRSSVPEGDPRLQSTASNLYRQMLDEEMSRLIAHSGKGLGLAEMLSRQLGEEGHLAQP